MSLGVISSSVHDLSISDTMVFQTHPTVLASNLIFAASAKNRSSQLRKEKHPITIEELFHNMFGLKYNYLVKCYSLEEVGKCNSLNSFCNNYMV